MKKFDDDPFARNARDRPPGLCYDENTSTNRKDGKPMKRMLSLLLALGLCLSLLAGCGAGSAASGSSTPASSDSASVSSSHHPEPNDPDHHT